MPRKTIAIGFAFVVLVVLGALVTQSISPGRPLGLTLVLALAVGGLIAGMTGARFIALERLVLPFTLAATIATALLFSPLGARTLGATRHVDLWISIEPSGLWVLSSHLATACALLGKVRKRWMWFNFAGASVAALLMPELSIIPQVAVGTIVITWRTGRKTWSIVPVVLAALAIGLSFLFPYVQTRWKGFLDPTSHAQGAGYDYRGLEKILSEVQWLGGQDGILPRVSSPADDYWLAAGMWHAGIVPIALWIGALIALLVITHRVMRSNRASSLLISAMTATMGTCLLIHAGYNLGLWPVTAISAPLVGFGGSLIGAQLMGLGLGLGSQASPEVEPDEGAAS